MFEELPICCLNATRYFENLVLLQLFSATRHRKILLNLGHSYSGWYFRQQTPNMSRSVTKLRLFHPASTLAANRPDSLNYPSKISEQIIKLN